MFDLIDEFEIVVIVAMKDGAIASVFLNPDGDSGYSVEGEMPFEDRAFEIQAAMMGLQALLEHTQHIRRVKFLAEQERCKLRNQRGKPSIDDLPF